MILHSSTSLIMQGSHHTWLTGARPQQKPAVGVLHPRTFSCCGAPIMPNLVLLMLTFVLRGNKKIHKFI